MVRSQTNRADKRRPSRFSSFRKTCHYVTNGNDKFNFSHPHHIFVICYCALSQIFVFQKRLSKENHSSVSKLFKFKNAPRNWFIFTIIFRNYSMVTRITRVDINFHKNSIYKIKKTKIRKLGKMYGILSKV